MKEKNVSKYVEPSVSVRDDYGDKFLGFATGKQGDGGAWTLHQANVLFNTGHNVVYCVRIDKMKINMALCYADAVEFFK